MNWLKEHTDTLIIVALAAGLFAFHSSPELLTRARAAFDLVQVDDQPAVNRASPAPAVREEPVIVLYVLVQPGTCETRPRCH